MIMEKVEGIVEVLDLPNFHVTEHFLYSDFICPCCDRLKIVPGFYEHLGKLERMRRELGIAIKINSGYRCPGHNKEVGGSVKSWHMLFATDIAPVEPEEGMIKEMYRMALSM